MSGGGKIVEKRPMTISGVGDVVRYLVMTEYRPGWFDETYVLAKPADDEPQLYEAIWWGGGQVIYFGENDKRHLEKVGYSYGV